MSLRDTLAGLPDDHPAYVPRVGEVTVGAIREAGDPWPVDVEGATRKMWCHLATRNIRTPGPRWLRKSSGGTARAHGESAA